MRYIFLLLVFLFSFSYGEIFVAKWDKAVTPVMADYIKRVIKEAEEENASAIILELDTPGGLESAMRDIIKSMMNTYIPFVVYVYPPGARAASAGAIITISADIAAMAPSTNIGSASPVQMTGKDIDETMKKKVINDMLAFVRSIAKEKGRNVKVIEKMITESINLSAEEALKKKVIDVIAVDLNDLINKIDGKTIKKKNAQIKLALKGQMIVYKETNLREKILSILTNPTVAYLLLMIGFYGIFFELYNPGSIIPGTIGALSLLLALYALNILSVNWLGVLLIILGIVFFALEVVTPTFGGLALGGIIALILGSIILISPDSPYGDISLKVILPTAVFSGAFFLTIAYLGIKAQMRKPLTGKEGMIGEKGEAITKITPKGGKVFIMGEIWEAYSDEEIPEGSQVEVVAVEGLKLKVKKV
ncbi:MAG: nodulation protein NfeD [Aquificae bacterium]|nr:nodulation protein NfeD [Aquificota bacterium]